MTALTVVRVGLFALTLVALGFVPGVSAANPASATGNGDFLVNVDQLRTFSFSAIQQPNGKVAGQAESHNHTTGGVAHMDIDCLRVIGNMAFVSGTITKSNISINNVSIVGQIGVFAAQDNGEGSTSTPDGLSPVSIFDPSQGVSCQSNITFGTIPILHGNIQVRPAAD